MEKIVDEIMMNFCKKIADKKNLKVLSAFAVHKLEECIDDEVVLKNDGKMVVVDSDGEEIAEISSDWKISPL